MSRLQQTLNLRKANDVTEPVDVSGFPYAAVIIEATSWGGNAGVVELEWSVPDEDGEDRWRSFALAEKFDNAHTSRRGISVGGAQKVRLKVTTLDSTADANAQVTIVPHAVEPGQSIVAPVSLAGGQLGNSEAALYTLGQRLALRNVNVYLANTETGTSYTVDLLIRRSGQTTSRRIIGKNTSLAPSAAIHVEGLKLSAGDAIRGFASVASKVDYYIDGDLVIL